MMPTERIVVERCNDQNVSEGKMKKFMCKVPHYDGIISFRFLVSFPSSLLHFLHSFLHLLECDTTFETSLLILNPVLY